MRPILRAACVSAALFLTFGSLTVAISPAQVEPMSHGEQPPEPVTVPSQGQVLLDKVKTLIGTWDAQTHDGVMTDIFKPFALGTAVLGEEWLNGKQITSTVFYVVNGELRADHFCDFQNQPRYTAVPSLEPDLLDFEFREATNLDTHPMHFHNTKWRIIDATHLVQDWFILGGKKPVSLAHMEFTKRPEAPMP